MEKSCVQPFSTILVFDVERRDTLPNTVPSLSAMTATADLSSKLLLLNHPHHLVHLLTNNYQNKKSQTNMEMTDSNTTNTADLLL
jgi:hypothetical protein